jgi:DNA-binding response OmpR family regulator
MSRTIETMRYEAGTFDPPAPPPRVIVADDDADVRRLVSAALQMDGFRVIEVDSGDALVDGIGTALLGDGQGPFDVVVTDIRMPGFTGLDVLACAGCLAVRTPMVLISAFDEERVRVEARRLGAHAFFAKPFDIDELRRAVQRAAGVTPPEEVD